jgi:prepilin-type N-terminal cleavage/methylation domain-containing protein
MRISPSQHGFTLPEMAITVAVFAILAALAVPSYQSTIDKRRIIGAAEELAANLEYARSEAIKGNQNVGVYFTSGDSWCYGISTNAACDCNTAAASCTVNTVQKVFTSQGFRGVTIVDPLSFAGGGTITGFEPRRGFSERPAGSVANGTVRFSSTSGRVHVVLSREGRIRLCSPSSKNVSGYSNSNCPLDP